MAEYLERIARTAWQHHYRVPEPAYWGCLIALAAVTPLVASGGSDYLAGAVLQLLAIAGIARWHLDRRRCRGALVVVRFREGGGTRGHAEEAQRIIIDSVRGRLAPAEAQFVQPAAVTISGDEKRFAATLARRLRARYVLHGRLASSTEGAGWSALPRLLEPASEHLMHFDPHTRDITTLRPSFEPLSSSLRPARGVSDDEFPFEFCRDLEALVRALAGLLAHAMDDDGRAVSLLQEALKASPQSTSHAIDGLRIGLAQALLACNDQAEALSVLRRRMKQRNPSPRLLRQFAFIASSTRHRISQKERRRLRAETIRALRQAVAHRSDPEWDVSAYNLMSVLSGEQTKKAEQEADALLEALLLSRSGYGGAWYVLRARGFRDWRRVEAARRCGDPDEAIAAGKEAAHWYGKALRARPRIRFFHACGPHARDGIALWVRFRESPILRANLTDAHCAAQHGVRTRWHEYRFRRVRAKCLRRARRRFEDSQWQAAYANYDWACVGRHDFFEIHARVYAAVSLHFEGRTEEAEEAWQKALAFEPFALIVRADAASGLRRRQLSGTVPGSEPVEMVRAVALAEQMYGHPIPYTGPQEGVGGYWYGAGRYHRGMLGILGEPLFWFDRRRGRSSRVVRRALVPLLRRHHRRHPGDLRLRYMLGINSLLRMQYPEAIEYFTEALEAAPGDYEALAGRAVALVLAGDENGARADLRRWRDFPPIAGGPGDHGFQLHMRDGEEARVLKCLSYGADEPRLLVDPRGERLVALLREVFPRGMRKIERYDSERNTSDSRD